MCKQSGYTEQDQVFPHRTYCHQVGKSCQSSQGSSILTMLLSLYTEASPFQKNVKVLHPISSVGVCVYVGSLHTTNKQFFNTGRVTYN